ncbi:MAG: AraC family transcriptional regulator [Trebonia sp.]
MDGQDRASCTPPAPQLLPGYQRVTSTDISVLHDAVEPLAVGHDLHPRDPAVPLDGIVNGLTLGSVSLVWVRYGGAGVIVDTPPTGGEFALCAPSAPMGVEYRRRHRRRGTAAGSLLLSHDEPMRMTPDPDRGCLVIATAAGPLTDHLHAHLGRPPARPLRFLPNGSTVLPSQVTDQAWQHACAFLDHTAGHGVPRMAARSIEQSLLTAILLGLPHTATTELAELDASGPEEPGTADKIREWLHAHHDQPVGVADLAAAMGLSVNRIQAICRYHWNQTPMHLLRGIRLDHARKALLTASPGATAPAIRAAALAAGFPRTTRFNAAYRQRFGQTPAETVTGAGSPPPPPSQVGHG